MVIFHSYVTVYQRVSHHISVGFLLDFPMALAALPGTTHSASAWIRGELAMLAICPAISEL